MLTVQELVDDNADKIPFNWISGQGAADRAIPDDGMSAADLVGHLNLIHPSRIQVFGQEELAYYTRFDLRRRMHHMDELLIGGVPAILLADGLTPPQDLIDQCDQHQVPLLSTPVAAAQLIDLLRIYLGKSELALELISRGHGLVADDAVEFSRTAPNRHEGHCPQLLQNLLEVRGLGLLDIRTIFGETSVRRKMRLKLIVHLVRATAQDKFERLPLQDITQDMLGLPVRKVMLQVAAGRNLAVLVEAAVRNTILKLRGIDTLGEFMERQAMAILQSSK
jgi:HPr kinase/phosphorylase